MHFKEVYASCSAAPMLQTQNSGVPTIGCVTQVIVIPRRTDDYVSLRERQKHAVKNYY